jgi:hypothetical protein
MGEMIVVGYGGERRNIPIRKGYLNIPTTTFRVEYVVSPTKGTLDPTLDPRYGVQNAS